MKALLSFSILLISRMIVFGTLFRTTLPQLNQSTTPENDGLWNDELVRAIRTTFMPPKHSVNTEYYINGILGKFCLPTFNHRETRASLTQRKMCRRMSDTIFMHDGAPVHTAMRIQNIFQSNYLSFGRKLLGLVTPQI